MRAFRSCKFKIPTSDIFHCRSGIVLIHILIFLGLGVTTMAQSARYAQLYRPRNNVGANILGDGSIVAGNYERLIVRKTGHLVALRVGYGFNSYGGGPWGGSEEFNTLSLTSTYNVGHKRVFFEAGLGVVFNMHGYPEERVIAFPTVGLRIQPLNAWRWYLRLSLQYPLMNYNVAEEILDYTFSPVGLAFGLSFGR